MIFLGLGIACVGFVQDFGLDLSVSGLIPFSDTLGALFAPTACSTGSAWGSAGFAVAQILFIGKKWGKSARSRRSPGVAERRIRHLKRTQGARATAPAIARVAGLKAPTRLLTAHKPHARRLVVGWMTTSESLLL